MTGVGFGRLLMLPLLLITIISLVSVKDSEAADTQTGARPNILLLLPDQMRGTAMGCMGNPDIQTPHLDQLAANGMLFRRTYANTPVCCPARAILLTGTYPHVNGMIANDLRLRESQVTIAEILKRAGYRTGFVGKWHLDGGPRNPGFVPPGPRRQGFDFWAAYECSHNHFEPTYFRDTPDPITVKKFEPEASCDFAVEFLKSQSATQPFFLTVQMGPPHDPYGAPQKYLRRYFPERITPSENWQAGSERRSPAARKRLGIGTAMSRYVPLGGLEEIAAYYAAISAIDDQVGRLMTTLKETGLEENTIVLFTSDHGDMLGSHGMRRKRKPYDESARVPGIMQWPKHIPAGRKVDTLFSHVDMTPTLLSLAGLQVPKHMQGHDLSRVALGETTDGPEAVLLQIFVPYAGDQVPEGWRGIVTNQFTYARFEKKPWVLFDHKKDPEELHNLVGVPEYSDLQQQLDDRLAALMKENGDDWSFNSSSRVEEGGRLYRHRTFYTLEEYAAWAAEHPDLAR